MWLTHLLVAAAAVAAQRDVCTALRCYEDDGTICNRTATDCPPYMQFNEDGVLCRTKYSFNATYCNPLPRNGPTPPPTGPSEAPKNTASPQPPTSNNPSTTATPASASASTTSAGEGTKWGMYVGIGAGALVFVVAAAVFFKRRQASDDDSDSEELDEVEMSVIVDKGGDESLRRILNSETENDVFSSTRSSMSGLSRSSVEF
ncbi:Aste57867_715 [Aphanomyces stellatus]|uniref:Aste57867_715 protein n=1 Tax=Aphanomyces stellatus TaxID=120398 RepID=A0A485K3M4_9STRA|nr:hypothetical protein As57867_000714 [Aphanomyces stellatus]VFT77939.1 Aste57867_715 [Aphanomyces stellatus]